MSLTDLSTEPSQASTLQEQEAPGTGAPAAASGPLPGRFWVRVVLACAVLIASGAVRAWQARRIGAAYEQERTAPFRLEELPLTLGDWRGEPATPDPEIIQATGATDSCFRRYVNQATGVALEVFILYGPAVVLTAHTPDGCYPGTGFQQRGTADDRVVTAGPLRAPFRNYVFGRGEGGQAELVEVYYTWRLQGRWSPDCGKFKQFERIPGMFKVQLSRRILGQERRDVGNPSETFLSELLPEIERRIHPPAAPSS